jgi:uncharacterized RDD family membrane protein YckC/uncharacterized Zn finger protein (UPF0148 family)
MNCPACHAPLVAGQERCAACGSMVAPAVAGALAPDTSRQTPPARSKAAPIREIPALRKRGEKGEKHWKEEVRERVQKRGRKPKASSELPLFADPAAAAPESPAATPSFEPEPPPPELPPEPAPDADLDLRAPEPPPAEPELREPVPPVSSFGDPLAEEPDLPLQRASLRLDIPEPVAHDPLTEARQPEPEEPALSEPEKDEWRLDIAAPPVELPPVERPAQFAERVEAAAVDAAVLGGLAVVVVYFASKAAHVPIEALLNVWPWLAAYLALLGLSYAAYFTGTTGQTPGKMLLGLRVVEASGGPPNYPRAFARAAAGAAGSLLAGVGVLPLFFDPARRALHDRLFRTRVVKF